MAAVASRSRWFNVRHPRPSAAVRLVCFPWSGGGSQWYANWGRLAPSHVEVVGLMYPQRESRYKDAPCETMGELAETIATEISTHLSDKPFAFFGHSFGVSASFEVCRRLLEKSGAIPVHMFFSGHFAPHVGDAHCEYFRIMIVKIGQGEVLESFLTSYWGDTMLLHWWCHLSDMRRQQRSDKNHPPWHTLSDADLTQRVKQLGGTPASILADKDFMTNIFLPPFRADLKIGADYWYVKQLSDPPPLSCPVTVVNGDGDADFITQEFSELTSGACSTFALPGNHFYLTSTENSQKLMDIISNQLK